MRTTIFRRHWLRWLALWSTGALGLLMGQTALMNVQLKRAALLEQQLAARREKGEVLPKREEMERAESLHHKNEPRGDHWLPGELDRLRQVKPAGPPGA